jgi:hypothetical protein
MDPQAVLAKELHRPRRRRYPTRHVITEFPNDLWQADIIEMASLLPWNKGYPYLLTVMDTFSKVAYARPLKNKTGKEVTEAFTDILKNTKVKNLQTDQGKEFFNQQFKTLMKEKGINHYHTFSDKKASQIERFNRTIKNIMWRHFTRNNSLKWVKILPTIVQEYNQRKHRTIGMPPNKVRHRHIPQIKQHMLKQRRHPPPPKHPFKIGNIVRISRIRNIFAKEASNYNWSEELFKVVNVQKTHPITYELEDLLGVPIKGTFYHQELQKTAIPDYARIEKVLARKTISGKPWVRVRFSGYDNRFNTWIPLSKTRKL